MKNGLSGMAAALLAGLMLMVGFGLGTAFGGDDVAPSSAPPEPAAAAREVRAAGPDTALRSTLGRQAASLSASAPATYQVTEAELQRARGKVDVDEAAASRAGTERITGSVFTAVGDPLADAVVVATLRAAGDPYGESTAKVGSGRHADPALDDILQSSAQRWAGDRSRRYRGQSAADGSYVIEGLPPGRYALSAYREGYVLERSGGGYYVLSGDSRDFTAQPVLELQVDVRMPDGSQPEVAAIRFGDGRGSNTARWTPAESVLRVAETESTAVALADFVRNTAFGNAGPARLRSDEVHFDSSSGSLNFVLRPQIGVYGRILGGAESRYDVRLVDLASNPTPTVQSFASSTRRAQASSGTYQFVDLDPGRYAVGILRGREALAAQVEVEVNDGLVEQHLEIPKASAAGSIRVLCLSPTGVPLPGVSFSYRVRSGRGSSSNSVRDPQRERDGAYLLAATSMGIEDLGNLPEGTSVQIVANHPRYGACAGQLTGGGRELTLQFEEPCRLTVLVPGFAQHPLRGSMTLSVNTRQQPQPQGLDSFRGNFGSVDRESATIRSDGTAEFPRLAPGAWQVRLQLNGGDFRGRTIAQVDVDLQNAVQQVSLPIPPLYDVVITATELEPGTNLWMRVKPASDGGNESMFNRLYFNGTLGDDRRWAVSNVPAGTYRVSANGAQGGTEIIVPGGPYPLDVKIFDCLKVAISDPNGVLHGAGLRPGDLVVAINGKTIADQNPWTVMIEEGRKKNVPLTVLRDGERFVLQGGDHAWYGEDVGGSLQPASTDDR